MKDPSSVSMVDIPAAKRMGRLSTAYQGSPAVAAPAVAASSATSVAVSKPRPKRTPTGYICQGL